MSKRTTVRKTCRLFMFFVGYISSKVNIDKFSYFWGLTLNRYFWRREMAVSNTHVLEVCVESVSSALNACQGGAKRLELCSSLCLGGLTPSLGLFTRVKKLVPSDCDIFVMIRPNQSQSFIYDSSEVEVMVEDIKIFRENGANGFVFGCLNESKHIDKESCKKLLEAASGLPSTFHRAFDITADPLDSLKQLIHLGFSRVLTSGQEKNAFLGRQLIRKLVSVVDECGSELIVMAGGGITPGNLREILETSKVKEFHGSARANLISSSDDIYVTDPSMVQEMVEIGKSFHRNQNSETEKH